MTNGLPRASQGSTLITIPRFRTGWNTTSPTARLSDCRCSPVLWPCIQPGFPHALTCMGRTQSPVGWFVCGVGWHVWLYESCGECCVCLPLNALPHRLMQRCRIIRSLHFLSDDLELIQDGPKLHTHAHTRTHTHTRAHTRARARMHARTHARTHTRKHTHMHTWHLLL